MTGRNCRAYVATAPVVLAAFDLVQRGVGEVELLGAVVDGQAVGGLNVAADDDEHVGSIQGGPHDAGRLLVPVGPEHETAGGTSTTMGGGNSQHASAPPLRLNEAK